MASVEDLTVAENRDLTGINLSSLERVTGDLEVEDNAALEKLNLSALNLVSSNLIITENDSLESIDLTGLENVGDYLEITFNGSLDCDADAILAQTNVEERATICGNLVDTSCGNPVCN